MTITHRINRRGFSWPTFEAINRCFERHTRGGKQGRGVLRLDIADLGQSLAITFIETREPNASGAVTQVTTQISLNNEARAALIAYLTERK